MATVVMARGADGGGEVWWREAIEDEDCLETSRTNSYDVRLHTSAADDRIRHTITHPCVGCLTRSGWLVRRR